MRHRVKTKRFKRTKAPRTALLRSLARSLVLHESIKTTLPKAKATRSLTERLITLGKLKSRDAERQLLRRMPDAQVVKKLLNELAQRYASREGGYTRVIRVGTRQGDAAPLARVSLIPGTTKATTSKGSVKVKSK